MKQTYCPEGHARLLGPAPAFPAYAPLAKEASDRARAWAKREQAKLDAAAAEAKA